MAVHSYEGRGEGCQEEVNVDVHHRFFSFLPPFTHIFLPTSTLRQAYHAPLFNCHDNSVCTITTIYDAGSCRWAAGRRVSIACGVVLIFELKE